MQRFYLETFEAAAGSSYRRTAYEKYVPYWAISPHPSGSVS
jgi:hypothetical protein